MDYIFNISFKKLDLVFKEVAGYDTLVGEIVDSFLIILNRYEELCKLNIQAPKNLLIHGIPGTGELYRCCEFGE